jgi:peroxiredoxin
MSPKPAQEFGSSVPDFTLPNIRGGEHSLSALMSGKKGAVVVFWSGVCSHCVRYDGYFNRFHEERSEFAFVALASRSGETREQILKTMDERDLRFPILHDANSAIARQWSTQQTPRAFLLDSDRHLLYRGAIDNFKYPGDADYIPWLEPAIGDFLAGRPISRQETPSFGCAIQSVYYILPRHI